MNLRVKALLPALLLCILPARAQDVPCEKYTLPNGMTVILHEDHALPVATVNTWYRVARRTSRRDARGSPISSNISCSWAPPAFPAASSTC